MKDTCIVCGQPFPAGLHVMGCLICFPCEKRLLWSIAPEKTRRGLCALYSGAHLQAGQHL